MKRTWSLLVVIVLAWVVLPSCVHAERGAVSYIAEESGLEESVIQQVLKLEKKYEKKNGRQEEGNRRDDGNRMASYGSMRGNEWDGALMDRRSMGQGHPGMDRGEGSNLWAWMKGRCEEDDDDDDDRGEGRGQRRGRGDEDDRGEGRGQRRGRGDEDDRGEGRGQQKNRGEGRGESCGASQGKEKGARQGEGPGAMPRGGHKPPVHLCVLLILVVLGCLVIRIILAAIVYSDLKKLPALSGIWIVVVLIAGIPGGILYALFRIKENKASA